MAVEIIAGEKELTPEPFIYAPTGMPYPLSGLDDRRFEKLIYWIYKEEIGSGIWSDLFDDIRLMSGVRDAGKDCVLYKNDIQLGIIQCKHSTKDADLTATALAAEIIKFGLYSLVETHAIKLYDGYNYYIATSAHFHSRTHDLIDRYQIDFVNDPNFKNWTTTVIKKYKALKHFKYEVIESALKANLKKLKILKIDGEEINKRLETPTQNIVIKHFFTIRSVVEKEALSPIVEKLGTISTHLEIVDEKADQIIDLVKPRPQRNSFGQVPGYLPRSVTGEADDIQFLVFGETKTFHEIISKHSKVALLGSGLMGKTTELKQLAYLLSTEDPARYVYLISLDVSTDLPISTYIKGIDLIPPKNLVVLLDGLDEVVPQYRTAARNIIESFVREFPDCLIVVSCRTNIYYTDEGNNEVNTLPGFESFTLQKLAGQQIEQLLFNKLGKDKEGFIKQIRQYDLEDLLAIPFYLIRLAEQFQKDRQIADSKAALFERIIRDGIKADVDRLKPDNPQKWESTVYESLIKLASILEITGKNYFTQTDLQQLFNDDEVLQYVKNTASLILGNDHANGVWSFIHNNFQEYLAARMLAKLQVKAIKRVVCFAPEYEVMKPTWLSTISFLLSILSQTNREHQKLLNWLEKENSSQLMMLDPGTLNADFRLEIFKRNYYEQKGKDLPFHHIKFNLKFIGRFIQSDKALEFITGELISSTSEVPKQALLKIVMHFDISAIPLYQSNFKRVLMTCAKGTDDYTRTLAINVWNSLFKITFQEFDPFFQVYRNSLDSSVRSSLFATIFKQDFIDDYLSFLMDMLEIINREKFQSYREKDDSNQRYLDEHIWIERSLLQVTSEKAVGDYLDWILKLASRKYFPSQLKTSFPGILKLVESYNLPTLVDKVVAIYIETGPFNIREQHEFIDFFNRTEQLNRVFKAVYALQSPPRYSELQILAKLADEGSIDFFIARYKAGELNVQHMIEFQDVLVENSIDLKIYFNMQMNAVHPFEFRVPPDHARKTFERDSKMINNYFDQTMFLEEVEKPMLKLGKNTALYSELQPIRIQNYQDDACFDFAFDVLRREHDFLEIDLDLIRQEIRENWEIVSIRWIYEFYKQRRRWKFTEDQRNYIVDWCSRIKPSVDFYSGQYYPNQRGDTPEAMILAFFVRMFDLKSYQDQFYLDMLFYPEWDQAAAQMEFIESRCTREQLIAQMLKNLYHRRLTGAVLDRHIKYFRTYKIKGATEGLFELLKDENIHAWHDVLDIYLELLGDKNRLWDLLLLIKAEHIHDAIIDRLASWQPEKVKTYLTSLFHEAEEKRKLSLAKTLIKLQSRIGFRYYIAYIQKNKIVPDYTSPDNPLYRVRSISLADLALKLYRLSFNPEIKYASINSLYYISTKVIENIYLVPKNRPKMKVIFALYMATLQLRKAIRPKEKYLMMIRDLQYLLEGVEHEKAMKLSSDLTFDQALREYNQIFRQS